MAIDFEALITKHAAEDGSIPASAVGKIASGIASAVGRDFVPKDRYNAKLDEISQLEQDKAAAEDSATKAGSWEKKYNKLKDEFDAFKADTEAKARLSDLKAAYKKLLEEAGIDSKRLDAILRATSFDGMKLDADGKLEDADKLKKAIESEWADFKVSTRTQGAKVETPPRTDSGTLTRAEIYAKDEKGRYKMSTAERQKALAEHPELMRKE